MFEETIAAIKPLNESAMTRCQIRLDNLTKPLDSLYAFEHLARKMAGITGNPRPGELYPKVFLINGSLRTPGMLDIFAGHVLAKIHEFDICDSSLNKQQCVKLVEQGMEMALAATAAGTRAIGIGMVGRLSPAVSSEIQAWFCNGDEDPVCLLTRMGMPELAAMTGIVLGSAAGGAAVVLDDLSTTAAALVAIRMAPQVMDYLVGSHFAAERTHAEALQLMDLPAYLYLGMNVGEGMGAALGISMLQASLHVLNDMKTFAEAEVHIAEDGPGALVQSKECRD